MEIFMAFAMILDKQKKIEKKKLLIARETPDLRGKCQNKSIFLNPSIS